MLVGITLLGIAMGWVAYQLNWIRARHDFLNAHHDGNFDLCTNDLPAPWRLRIFREHGFSHTTFTIEEEFLEEAKSLFPEARRFYAVKSCIFAD